LEDLKPNQSDNDLNGAKRLNGWNDLNVLNKVSAITVNDMPNVVRQKITVGAANAFSIS